VGQLCNCAVAVSELRKRVCLLTGASGRLGRVFTRLYCHRYDIAAVYCARPIMKPPDMCWDIDPMDPCTRKPMNGHRFEAIRADLSNRSDIPRIVDFTLATFGRVDLLVNAAAIVRCAPLLSAELTSEDLDRMLDLNTVVPLRLAAELARRFWCSRAVENAALNRSIVNISSTSGAYIFPGRGQGGYSASKAALNMLTCHMAEEFSAFGIRVNAVAPDSFPELVTTESVCDAIARVDRDAMTGKMLLLETERETVL
jgi:NAD(P)-dependent dehydrogenase (short-subunit alcohol dehydrogenase family)